MAAVPALPTVQHTFLLLLLLAATATVMLLVPFLISLCAGLLPTCIAQNGSQAYGPAESAYTVASGFPTFLFSSYYIEPAPTQEVRLSYWKGRIEAYGALNSLNQKSTIVCFNIRIPSS